MGRHETCTVCGQNEGDLRLADGVICKECVKRVELFYPKQSLKKSKTASLKNVLVTLNENDKRTEIFTPDRNVNKDFYADSEHHLWRAPKTRFPSLIFKYESVKSFDLIKNGSTEISGGGVGRAVVGGALFGGVGAIVGATTAKKTVSLNITQFSVKICMENEFIDTLYINLMNGMSRIKEGSVIYSVQFNIAQQILSELTLIQETCSKNHIEVPSSDVSISASTDDVVDDIRKFKTLLDEGLLTQEEFDIKKKQLLGL